MRSFNQNTLTKWVYEAYLIAEEAHRGQTRKGSFDPYITHPVRVSYRALSKAPWWRVVDVQVVSLLHDVIEDTDHTVESLKAKGIGGWADVVDVLTRYPDETYFDYIRKIKRHADEDGHNWETNTALIVKLADIEDNLDDMPPHDKRTKWHSLGERYRKALAILSSPPQEES